MTDIHNRTTDAQVRALVQSFAQLDKPLPDNPGEFDPLDTVLYRLGEYLRHYRATGEMPDAVGAFDGDDLETALVIFGDAQARITAEQQQ